MNNHLDLDTGGCLCMNSVVQQLQCGWMLSGRVEMEFDGEGLQAGKL